MFGQFFLVAGGEIDRAESLEDMLEITEIGAIFNHLDAEIGEFLRRRRANAGDLRFHRGDAQIGAESHPPRRRLGVDGGLEADRRLGQ